MKLPSIAFLACFLLCVINAQEASTKWDVEIPVPLADGTPSAPIPMPEPLELKVKSSRTTRMNVVESPEMHDLPPITGTINVTTQLVENPNLPDPPPLPALPPDDPAVMARLAELRIRHRYSELVFLSATVYDHQCTFLRIYPNGKVENAITAWSNLNFNHFSGFSTFRVKDFQDGSFQDFGLLMGIYNYNSQRKARQEIQKDFRYSSPEMPEIPAFAKVGPAFVVVEGEKKSPAMDTLEQIHDLYRKEGKKMEKAYYAREKAHAERKAYLRANPPKPIDVTTWISPPRRVDPPASKTSTTR